MRRNKSPSQLNTTMARISADDYDVLKQISEKTGVTMAEALHVALNRDGGKSVSSPLETDGNELETDGNGFETDGNKLFTKIVTTPASKRNKSETSLTVIPKGRMDIGGLNEGVRAIAFKMNDLAVCPDCGAVFSLPHALCNKGCFEDGASFRCPSCERKHEKVLSLLEREILASEQKKATHIAQAVDAMVRGKKRKLEIICPDCEAVLNAVESIHDGLFGINFECPHCKLNSFSKALTPSGRKVVASELFKQQKGESEAAADTEDED